MKRPRGAPPMLEAVVVAFTLAFTVIAMVFAVAKGMFPLAMVLFLAAMALAMIKW